MCYIRGVGATLEVVRKILWPALGNFVNRTKVSEGTQLQEGLEHAPHENLNFSSFEMAF